MDGPERWTIRRAMHADRPVLLDLWERSARTSHQFLSEADLLALRPAVERELASERYDWWVSTRAEQVVAFMAVAGCRLEALFVDEGWQRTGLGRALVAHAQAHCGAGEMTVDVNEQNTRARQFYAALGFEEVGSSPTDDAGRAFPIVHLRRSRTS